MTLSKTVSFRAAVENIKVLDKLATVQDRDRTYLLNEALEQYLELNQHHLDEIRKGLRQAETGKLVGHDELKRKAAKWRAKK